MQGTFCALSCALEKLLILEDSNPFLSSSIQHLTKAKTLADAYHKTKYSIIWISADRKTKQRVKGQMNTLAYDAYSAFLQGIADINTYADCQYEEETKGNTVNPPPPWWNDMLLSLKLAQSGFLKEHQYEISSRQLSLFEKQEFET